MAQLIALDGPRLDPASGGPARGLVIFTHGYGSNGEDLIGLAPYWAEALADVAFVSPNAPYPCPGAPGGYQWWDIGGADRVAGVRSAAPIVDAFIDAELARHGLSEDRLALVGFSQGTMLALHVAPRRTRQLAGVVGYSGALLDDGSLESEIVTRPPVVLVHGDADPMVPVAALQRAAEGLSNAGLEVSAYVSRGLGHSIDPGGLRIGQEFLQRVLG